jgi:hypothetical protein
MMPSLSQIFLNLRSASPIGSDGFMMIFAMRSDSPPHAFA